MVETFVVIFPVFCLVALGYGVIRFSILPAAASDTLMSFAYKIAVPCLLFNSVSALDIGETFSVALLGTYFTAAFLCFILGFVGARMAFVRTPEDAVVIGFCCLFSNTYLIGIPLMERAFGSASTDFNFAIISLHASFCFIVGILAMEIVRPHKRQFGQVVGAIGKSIFSNPMMVAVLCGFIANAISLELPTAFAVPVDMLATAALPVGLFGMGCALVQYKLRRSVGVAMFVVLVVTLVHPALILGAGLTISEIAPDAMRSAVVTAAMPTGFTGYVFASMYQRATGAAASAVLLSTLAVPVTSVFWITVLRSVFP